MADKKNEILRSGGNGRRSTCVAHGGLLYISGITTVDIEADIEGQAKDVFSQIDKILASHGTDKNSVLSATVFLRSMDDYGKFNAVWDEWVIDGYEPARSVVEAATALPEYCVKVALVAAL